MVNMIVLNHYLGRPTEVNNRYLSQLRDSNKNHPFVRDLQQKVKNFKAKFFCKCEVLFNQ
jgi:hypothetical protein